MSFAGRLVYLDGILRPDIQSSEPEKNFHDGAVCYVYLPAKAFPKVPQVTVLQYEHGILVHVFDGQPFRISEKPPTYLMRTDCHNVRCTSR